MSYWKWIAILLFATMLVVANILFMVKSSSLQGEEAQVKQSLADLKLRLEQHQARRVEYTGLKSLYRSRLREIQQLIFLCEKHEVELPGQDLFPANNVALFESHANETVRWRIFLPANFKLKMRAYPVSSVSDNTPMFSTFDEENAIQFSISGEGWHSIDRMLVGKNSEARAALLVDDEEIASMNVGQSQIMGTQTSGRIGSRLIPAHPNGNQWSDRSLRSGWCKFAANDDDTQQAFGYAVDRFELVIDKNE